MFTTMNPMYSERSEVPENLKSLFRPIAMMVPDTRMITEISLYAAGYSHASVLAAKIVTVLRVTTE